MTSVKIVFRKDKLNKQGSAPIHFRITKNRKITYITSGFLCHQDEWDDANKRIKGKSKSNGETTARMNAMISQRFSEIQNEVLSLEGSHKEMSTKAIRQAVIGKGLTSFFDFADQVAERFFLENKIGSHSRAKSILAKLKEYAFPLNFQDITPKFLTDYETYLKKEKKNKTNTIHGNFKFLRSVFNQAYRLDLIDHESNPFLKFRMKSEKTQRVYLTENELAAFEAVETTIGTRMDMHKDMFVFAAYTGGLRVSDMLQLQWKNVEGTHLNFTIKKTKNQFSIKLPDKALAIMEKYRPAEPDFNAYIFPMLPPNTYNETSVVQDKEISCATAYINKNLKLIATKAEIAKNVSFHISRHTWATRALTKGVSIDKVSKLMGHANIKETQIYAKIVNSELDKAMDAFND